MTFSLTDIEDQYDVLDELHEGGMGKIYLVQHRLLKELRVVKTMRRQLSSDAAFRSRFLQEAQLAASTRGHPHIATTHDFQADENGNGLIVMEYIDGISLEQLARIHIKVLDLSLILEIAQQSLRALGFLHRIGYVHRDISPDNIMLGEDIDGRPHVTLIDLGIAKKIGGVENRTAPGHFLGKLRYSSPEHFKTNAFAPHSDVYSFGLVLYELLTGQQAVWGSDIQTYCEAHLYQAPLKFETTDPGGKVPNSLRGIVLKSLAKDPQDRFRDGSAFLEAIQELREDYPLGDDFRFTKLRHPGREMDSPSKTEVEIPRSLLPPKDNRGPSGPPTGGLGHRVNLSQGVTIPLEIIESAKQALGTDEVTEPFGVPSMQASPDDLGEDEQAQPIRETDWFSEEPPIGSLAPEEPIPWGMRPGEKGMLHRNVTSMFLMLTSGALLLGLIILLMLDWNLWL